ncbi:uncharacterized protein LOC144133731 isoform X2 [Amblyomma americanum]
METPCVAPPTSRTLHTLAEDGSFRGASRIRTQDCPADPPPRGQHAISSWEDWEVLLMSADPTSQLAAVTRAADVISRHDLLDAVRDRAVAQGPSWV